MPGTEILTPDAGSELLAAVYEDELSLSGFVLDPENASTVFAVELLLDGWHAQLCRADLYDHRLAAAGKGDACHGFLFYLPQLAGSAGAAAEVRIANTEIILGHFQLGERSSAASKAMGPGTIVWQGGLRFTGWLVPTEGIPSRIRGLIDELIVADVMASSWTVEPHGRSEHAVMSFDFHLPARLADGRLRRLEVINGQGEALRGSPIPFIAFAETLESLLMERAETSWDALRGRLSDVLLPQSMPFAWIKAWQVRFPLPQSRDFPATVAIILIGEDAVEASLESLKHCKADWIVAVIPAAERDGRFASGHLVEFLTGEGAACAQIIFALSGTVFEADAPQRLAQTLIDFPKACAAYADILLIDSNGLLRPIALPSFDYERMLEQGYCASLFAMRRAEVLEALSAGTADLFRLVNGCADKAPSEENTLIHVPGFLAACPSFELQKASEILEKATRAHLSARGVPARTQPVSSGVFPAVRIRRTMPAQRITVIIGCGRRTPMIESVEALRQQHTSHRVEVLVAGSRAADPDILEHFRRASAQFVEVSSQSSAALAFNHIASMADGDCLLFLDDHVRFQDPDTIEELVSRLARQDAGAVGLNVTWPSGTLRDAGGVLGVGFRIAAAGSGLPQGAPGYADMLLVARECSALSSPPLLTRRADFLSMGGFNHIAFPNFFFLCDYCLRQRRAGRRIVITPHDKVMSQGPQPFDMPAGTEAASVFAREVAALRDQWGHLLMEDPYYNPVLSLDIPFSALAWPPRDLDPRSS